MKISNIKISHGLPKSVDDSLYLVQMGDALAETGRYRCGVLYSYIVFAGSPEDAITRVKANAEAVVREMDSINSILNSQYPYKSDKIKKIIEYIDKGWVEATIVDDDRAIPVSYFDDYRSNI